MNRSGPDSPLQPRRRAAVREYLEVLVVIAVVTAIGPWVPLSYRAFGQVYLLVVVVLSLRVGRGPVLAAAVVSAVAWNFVFLPPRYSFHVFSVDDSMMLGTYFVVALIAGQLTTRTREREKLFAQAELHRTLLDSVSHELKTPLAVLRTAAEKVDTEDPKKRTALAAEIRTATNRLDRLVANLLNQTRLESGGVHAQLDWCDVRDLINAAHRASGETLGDRPLKIEVPADLPLFRADAPLMEHVLANLLVNAALHTPAGGGIRVAAGVEPDTRRVFISVSDHGPGIPLEVRQNLFRKFQRGQGARAGGLGLGLSIVRGFMRAQGGAVATRNLPEGGAEFTVYLPYAPHSTVPGDES